EVEGDRERLEADGDEDLQEQRQIAADVEETDGVAQRGGEELVEAELAVVVGVVPVEADSEADTTEHARAQEGHAHLGARRQLAMERHDREGSTLVVDRLEEKAVEDLAGLARLDGLADAIGVEAGDHMEAHAGC